MKIAMLSNWKTDSGVTLHAELIGKAMPHYLENVIREREHVILFTG